MGSNTTLEVGFIITCVLFVFSCYTFVKGRKDDTKKDTKEQIEMNLQLSQLCNTMNETRTDIRSLVNDSKTLRENQIKLSAQIDSMWKRIDDFKARLEKLEDHVHNKEDGQNG